jgi:NADH-quinone oxidoreductase subunit A
LLPVILGESYLAPYLPAGIYLLILLGAGLTMLSGSRLLGPRRPDPKKTSTYECGAPLVGTSREQFPVKFYLVAILFVLFDIETVFLIPWAVVFRRFGFQGVGEMLIFLLILSVGLLYIWRRRGLEWE